VIVVLKLIYHFTGLTYGPRRLVSPAVLRMPEPCMCSMCATVTVWRDFTTPEKKRLIRGAVPCSSDWASQGPTPRLSYSALTDMNSIPSLLPPQKNLHVTSFCVLCIDCILLLTVALSFYLSHLAICSCLYWLHLLCLWCRLLHLLGFLCCTHRLLVVMCFISFVVSCSLVGSPVADISTATDK
jgi:hypothetical protein